MQRCPLPPGSGELWGCLEFWPLPSPPPGCRNGAESWEQLGTLGQTGKIMHSTFTIAVVATSAAAA